MLDVEEKKQLNLLESLTALFKVMSVIIRFLQKCLTNHVLFFFRYSFLLFLYFWSFLKP